MVLHKLHTNQTNQELEKRYSGKHIIPYKVESFTAKLNNRISDENDENLTKSLYFYINELNDKLMNLKVFFKKHSPSCI